MNEQSFPFEPEKINELAKTTKDLLPKMINETDGALSTLMGLFNNIILYPLKKANITYKHKLECFENDFKERVSNIPREDIIEPKLNIIGPTLEALKYTYDEEELRKLFTNLLLSSVDIKKENNIHPAFVDIIKQLSPLDAKLLSMFKYKNTYPCIETYEVDSNEKITPHKLIIFDFLNYSSYIHPSEHMQLTPSLVNLIRLGIVLKNYSVIELNYDYDNMKNHWLFKAYTKTMQKDITIKMKRFRIELTEFGDNFTKCCF